MWRRADQYGNGVSNNQGGSNIVYVHFLVKEKADTLPCQPLSTINIIS
jgi:hypothetical protein